MNEEHFTWLPFKDWNAMSDKPADKSADMVNHPPHYQGKTFEAIDVIEEFGLGYHLGNVIKYVLRSARKCGLVDLKKALWYLDRFIMELEASENKIGIEDLKEARWHLDRCIKQQEAEAS